MNYGIARRMACLVPVSMVLVIAMSATTASADVGGVQSRERGQQERGRDHGDRDRTTICNGQPDGSGNGILTGTYNNVVVPPGYICELLHATVKGYVVADKAKQLGMDDTTVGEFVAADRVTDNGFICGSTIHEDVVVSRSSSAPLSPPGTWVIGDESYCGDKTYDPKGPGNFVGGNLVFDQNQSGGMVSNNDVEKDLVCEHNTPAPTGHNNAVDGRATGQCTGLLTFPAIDDSMSPADGD